MKKFKLIKEYPGSPELGQIALPYTDSKNAVAHYIVDRNNKKDCDFIALSKKWVENQPEYWEEVNDNIWWVVFEQEHIQNDKVYFKSWTPCKIECIKLKNGEESRHWFKTKEEAESFILFNKPCLSYNEVKQEMRLQVSQQGILQSIYHIVKSKL